MDFFFQMFCLLCFTVFSIVIVVVCYYCWFSGCWILLMMFLSVNIYNTIWWCYCCYFLLLFFFFIIYNAQHSSHLTLLFLFFTVCPYKFMYVRVKRMATDFFSSNILATIWWRNDWPKNFFFWFQWFKDDDVETIWVFFY